LQLDLGSEGEGPGISAREVSVQYAA